MKINSINKAIMILNCFEYEEPILSVGKISKMTDFTISTVSRILSTLEAGGVVEKASGYGQYQLGYQAYIWGVLSRNNNNLTMLSKPIMKELCDICGEEVSLYRVVEEHRVCLERIPSGHAIAMTNSIGKKLPLHTGASGQVLLAYLPKENREAILNKPLEQFTQKTVTNSIELRKKLKQIRKQGYAVSREEREPGAFSIVAPIWNVGNRVIASLTIAGPLYRLDDIQLDACIKNILKSANKISKKIGFKSK